MRASNIGRDVRRDLVVVALATFPEDQDALDFLHSQGIDSEAAHTLQTIANKRISAAVQVEKVRREIGPELEQELCSDLLDEDRRLTVLIGLCVNRAMHKIQNEPHLISDPAKMARDLAQVRQQGNFMRMGLEGRPTQITESRNLDEIARQLVAMGAATVEGSAVPAEIPEHTA